MIMGSCLIHVFPLFQRMTRASSLSCPMNAAFPKVPMQHLHSESYRKFVKMGQMLSWMLTIVPLYVFQLALSVGELEAVRSDGRSTSVLHSMVSLCNVVVCCLSMGGDL